MQCPLCLSFQFASLRALRDALINCTQRPVSCPLCADSLRGLDKFTAHLFAHLLSDQTAAHGHWLDTCVVSPAPADDEDSLMSLLRCRETVTENNMVQETVIEVNPCQVAVIQDTAILECACPEIVSENNVVQDTVLEVNSCRVTVSQEAVLVESRETVVEDHGGQETLQQVTVNVPSESESLGSAEGMILEQDCDRVRSATAPNAEDGDDVGAKRPFACFRCSKAFRSRGSLLVHMRIAHNAPRNAQLQLVQPALSPPHPPDSPVAAHGKAWECATCHKRFSTKYFLAKHQRLHTGETPYTCATCGKSFTFQQSLHKHLLYHSAVKPHACPDCGRCFKELSTLANHRRIHSGEKPFPCDTCGKRFRQRVSWLVHRRIHTGALPYECTSCGQRFRYKVSQRTHKCPAQPPGAVVRAPSDLLARLKAAQITSAQTSLQQPAEEAPVSHEGLPENPVARQGLLDASSVQQEPLLMHHGVLEATSLINSLLEGPSVHHSPLEATLYRQNPHDNSTLRQGLVEVFSPSLGQMETLSAIRQGLLDAPSGQQGLMESTLRRSSDFPILRTIDEESLRQLLDSTTLQ